MEPVLGAPTNLAQGRLPVGHSGQTPFNGPLQARPEPITIDRLNYHMAEMGIARFGDRAARLGFVRSNKVSEGFFLRHGQMDRRQAPRAPILGEFTRIAPMSHGVQTIGNRARGEPQQWQRFHEKSGERCELERENHR